MNLFELFVEIGVKDKASKALSGITNTLGNGIKTAAKVGLAAVGTAAAGITALMSSAINNYAEYEQLVGGVETLFGDSADKVREYAMQAYQSAGLSANEYMNTVTSFSASLLQSLGGDTAKAAEYADRAIRDMADNANKMGTDISMIQSAYQGFAKQNYTMLDNLKLGYGGTKTEMARLVKDAAALTDVQKELGIVVDANDASFGNIVNAISVMQKQMGIAGATSDEAGRTIQGSVNAMKSAWQNLLTGMADSNADFETLTNNFVTSITGDGSEQNKGVLGNILPRVEIALNGIGKLIEGLAPTIIKALPGLASSILPAILGAAKELVMSIGQTILNNADLILEYGINLVKELMAGVQKAIPQVMQTAKNLVKSLVKFIKDNLPELLKGAVAIVKELAKGIADSADELLSAIADLIVYLALELTNPDVLVPIFEAALEIVVALADGLINALPTLIGALPVIITQLVASLLGFIPEIVEAGVKLLGSLLSNAPAIAIELAESIPTIIWDMIDAILGFIPDMMDVGKQLIDGLLEGVKSAASGLWEGIKDVGGGIVDGFKWVFGIKSPSRVFKKEIGKNLILGIGAGFDEEMPKLRKKIDNGIGDLAGDIGGDLDTNISANMAYGSIDAAVGAGMTSISGVEINIYADQAGDSAESIADAVAIALQDLIDRRSAVYA